MNIDVKKENNALVVTVSERIDSVTAPDLGKKLNELIEQGSITFVLDFSNLDYISSAGLRTILVTAKNLESKGGKILIASLNSILKELFEISGFATLFKIFDSTEDALADL